MALIKANIWRIFFCLLIFFLMSGLDFIGVLVFEELLGRFKEKKVKILDGFFWKICHYIN